MIILFILYCYINIYLYIYIWLLDAKNVFSQVTIYFFFQKKYFVFKKCIIIFFAIGTVYYFISIPISFSKNSEEKELKEENKLKVILLHEEIHTQEIVDILTLIKRQIENLHIINVAYNTSNSKALQLLNSYDVEQQQQQVLRNVEFFLNKSEEHLVKATGLVRYIQVNCQYIESIIKHECSFIQETLLVKQLELAATENEEQQSVMESILTSLEQRVASVQRCKSFLKEQVEKFEQVKSKQRLNQAMQRRATQRLRLLEEQQHQTNASESKDRSKEDEKGSSASERQGILSDTASLPSTSEEGKPSNTLISEYNIVGNLSSLQGLQSALCTNVNHTLLFLKLLTLKGHTISSSEDENINPYFTVKPSSNSGIVKDASPIKYAKGIHQHINTILYPQSQLVGGITGYDKKLTCNEYVTKVKLLKMSIDGLNIGLSYDAKKNVFRTYDGLKMPLGCGSARIKTETHLLATVASWNTKKSGPTGQVAICCGLGKMKAIRAFSHGDIEEYSKGNSTMYLHGALSQVGYTICLNNKIRITPYMECTFVKVQKEPYKEYKGVIPTTISGHYEKLFGKGLGIHIDWNQYSTTALQVWSAITIGQHHTSQLVSSSSLSPLFSHELAIPMYQIQHLQTEIGLSYRRYIKDSIAINVNGHLQFEKIKKCLSQSINLALTYSY